jgi:hypothetical protein
LTAHTRYKATFSFSLPCFEMIEPFECSRMC